MIEGHLKVLRCVFEKSSELDKSKRLLKISEQVRLEHVFWEGGRCKDRTKKLHGPGLSRSWTNVWRTKCLLAGQDLSIWCQNQKIIKDEMCKVSGSSTSLIKRKLL